MLITLIWYPLVINVWAIALPLEIGYLTMLEEEDLKNPVASPPLAELRWEKLQEYSGNRRERRGSISMEKWVSWSRIKVGDLALMILPTMDSLSRDLELCFKPLGFQERTMRSVGVSGVASSGIVERLKNEEDGGAQIVGRSSS
jgi:hypothetical protein